MPWEQAVFDDVAGWNGSTDYVCDRPGLFLVGATVRRSTVATAATSAVRVRNNGVTVAETQMISTTASVTITCVGLIEVAAGDVVTCNPSLVSVGTGNLEAVNSVFWGVRVGPVAWT